MRVTIQINFGKVKKYWQKFQKFYLNWRFTPTCAFNIILLLLPLPYLEKNTRIVEFDWEWWIYSHHYFYLIDHNLFLFNRCCWRGWWRSNKVQPKVLFENNFSWFSLYQNWNFEIFLFSFLEKRFEHSWPR